MDTHAGVFLAIFVASLMLIFRVFDDKPKPEHYIKEFKAVNEKVILASVFKLMIRN